MHYTKPIDPHVHLRGTEYAEYPFLEWGIRDAEKVGLAAVMEQPNPVPQLTTEDVIKERIVNVTSLMPDLVHRIHIGMTNNKDQVRKALELIMGNEHGLVSDKVFYTHSTGNMGILDELYQQWLWHEKGEQHYKGVSIGHFEDEKKFIPCFDASKPASHSKAQPPEAEIVQVMRQIKHAYDGHFRGTFYVAHISNPDTLDYLQEEMKYMTFKIVREVTWHHMFLNTDDYKVHGNRVKMNPPLRSEKLQKEILKRVLAGKLEVIGTDHAPHPLTRKDNTDKPASGIPAIPFWPCGIWLLRKLGMKEEVIENITFNNANEIFKLDLPRVEIDGTYDRSLWDKYGFNPFSSVDKDFHNDF